MAIIRAGSLEFCRVCLGITQGQLAWEVTRRAGVALSRLDLAHAGTKGLTQAQAQALAAYLSSEFDRPFRTNEIKGLRIRRGQHIPQ